MTIVAISTATGAAGGIGIVRMSGERALDIAKQIFFVNGAPIADVVPNMMTLGAIKYDKLNEKAFCVYYKAPRSFTGEDVVELHCHGGMLLLNTVVRALVALGATPAARGEFSKRAFLNRKITLDEAEGIIDVIEAETTAELNQAHRLMHGAIGAKIEELAELLTYGASALEVQLDYPEEIDEDTFDEALAAFYKAKEGLETLLNDSEKTRLIKKGATVVIAGEPNVGKSSLLNAILKEDRAIVTNIAGTTRDTLSESVEVDGIKINFTDTAGLRETTDEVERIGVIKAETAIGGADLVLEICDLTRGKPERKIEGSILVGNKCDAVDCACGDYIAISAKTGKGIDELLKKVLSTLDLDSINHSDIVTRERHIALIKASLGYLKSAIGEYKIATTDCTLIDIRASLDCLMKIVGKVTTDEIIDDVFSRFCVGK